MSTASFPSDMKGSVQYCPSCDRKTPHLTAPKGYPVCTQCGFVQPGKKGR